MNIEHHSDQVVIVTLSRRNVIELYRQIEHLDAGDYSNVGLHKVEEGGLLHVTIETDESHYGDQLAKVRDFNYGRGQS